MFVGHFSYTTVSVRYVFCVLLKCVGTRTASCPLYLREGEAMEFTALEPSEVSNEPP